MPLQRQLPKLCLRGSIANITMAGITEEEREEIDQMVRKIVNNPDLQPKRASIIRGFQTTIGWDFKDDRAIADQEYHIAVWRGVVNLFYHHKYSFKCLACNSAYYMTKRSKLAPIDRQHLKCPNCGNIEVADPGESELVEGCFLPYEEFQALCANYTDVQRAPTCRSPIEYIPGKKSYDNPEDIINDPVQLSKFIGEYGWNYCRQQIAENERAEHRKAPRKIVGRADEIILQELLALCKKMKLDYFYEPDNIDDRAYNVFIVGLLTPPEFSVELALLRRRALLHDIKIETISNGISVLKNSGALNITSKVSMPEHVMYQEENDSEEQGFTLKQISYRTVEGERMDQDDHVQVVDTNDVLEAVRVSLPDGTCKAVFDIDSGLGQAYNDFSDRFGDNPPKKCHMAEFLGVPHRTIGLCREQIKVHCLSHGLVPTS